MRSSRGSTSDDSPSWRSRKAWERDFWSRLDALRAGRFLVDDRVKRAESSSGALTFRGRLYFEHGLILEFSIAFEQRGEEILPVQSGYHAAFADPHLAIFRYDDAHPHPGHPDHLHKHVFDPPGAPDPGTVVWIGRDNWPTLFDVVRELEDWWETTGFRLPLSRP